MSGQNYEAACAALKVARAAETACYDHSQAMTPIERALSARLVPAFTNLPLGLQQFTPDALGADDATYLLLDTGGPNGGISYGARLSLTRIGFAENATGRRAIDLTTGVDLGEVNRWSFTDRDEPDWMRYGDQTRRRVWRELRYTTFWPTHRTFEAILPMTGPVLMHGACRRLAQMAGAIWRGEVEEIATMRAHDAEMDRLVAAKDAAQAECRRVAVGLADVEALAAAHPALASDLRGMDWTYDYADRADPRYRERELRIRSAMWPLSIDDALALFVGLNPIWFDRFASYLCRHPYVVAREAGGPAIRRLAA